MFLFGAGASAFSGACFPSAPPLGAHLFAKMRAEGYVSANLPDDARAKFESDGDFERGMELLASYDSTYYMPFLRGMARFFAPFRPEKGNLFLKLFALLLKNRVRFLIATLNYENMIEHALQQLGTKRGVVLKPHGSCGFLPDLESNLFVDVSFKALDLVDFQSQSRVVLDPLEIERWCLDPANAFIAPVMSFYAPGKVSKVSRDIIDAHRAAWVDGIAKSDVCFIVGIACNPLDQHIWDCLKKGRCRLIYVNPVDGGFRAWLDATGRRYAEHWPIKFADAIPRIIGHSLSSR